MRRVLSTAALFVGMLALCMPSHAQFAGTATRDPFLDTTVLRPPAGSKVAIIVFEDLGCPACARAHPFELDAVQKTHVPFVRHDFPLQAHIWTFDGAVDARYIEHTMGPAAANEFRTAVFASQALISNKDDLRQFTANWLKKHGRQMPMVIDPKGDLAKEVNADLALGKRLNVEYTPTLVVVTRKQYQTVCGTSDGKCDPTELMAVVKGAMAQAK